MVAVADFTMRVSIWVRMITSLLLRLDIFGVYLMILEVRDATRKEKYETEKQF